MGRPAPSLSHEPLPDEPIRDADFDELVFDVGARGYRMSQVDGVVDRLRRELREKDEEIAVLRGEPAVPVAEPADPAKPVEVTEATEVTEAGEPVGLGQPAPDGPDGPAQSDPTVGRERTT